MTRKSLISGVSVLCFSLALTTAPASACNFHNMKMGTIGAAYPGSMTVAVAIAKAKSNDLVETVQLSSGANGLKTASKTMRTIGSLLDKTPEDTMTPFYVLLVDRLLWTQYYVEQYNDGRAFNVFVHTAAPTEDVPVLLTSYDVLQSMLSGRISPSAAVETGVIRITGDQEERVLEQLETAFASS